MSYLSRTQFEQLSPAAQSRFLSTHIPLGSHPETHDELYLGATDRFAGTYVLGVQGTGKSGLLENLIAADAALGNAIVVIDPHGDLVTNVLATLPPHRIPQTYLLDMADEAFPFGLNLFATSGRITSEIQRQQAIERIMHVFEVLWADVLEQQNLPRYVRAATIVFLDNPGATVADMLRFLLDPAFRAQMLGNVRDPDVRRFWAAYEALTPTKQQTVVQPLINRLESLFMGRSLVRNIVGQRKSTISFRKAIEEKQIILVKLPLKTVAQDARLVGTIILTQLYSAVFSFGDLPEAQRPGVSLYVDEFQHFATPDFASLFSEGRKFGVRLTLAHQYRGQLPDYLQDSTRTARTKIVFRVTAEDGKEMAQYVPLSGEGKLEAVETHPVKALLDGTWQDYPTRVFIDTYLRSLKRQVKAGKVEIERPGVSLAKVLWSGYQRALEEENPTVDDPTQYLDALLREVMETSNPNLAIPYKAVLGFSNCGRGFYQAARKAHGSLLLTALYDFPATLVESGQWQRPPKNGQEQLLHFVYHLRGTMAYLAAHPIGKRASITPAMVAQLLTSLPQRTAYVNAGGEVGPIYTHNTPPRLVGDEYSRRFYAVQAQTRERYCHPKTAVEQAFVHQVTDETASGLLVPDDLLHGVHEAIQHTVTNPVNRWAEVEGP